MRRDMRPQQRGSGCAPHAITSRRHLYSVLIHCHLLPSAAAHLQRTSHLVSLHAHLRLFSEFGVMPTVLCKMPWRRHRG